MTDERKMENLETSPQDLAPEEAEAGLGGNCMDVYPPRCGSGYGWDDYLELGVFAPLRVAREIAKSDKVNALGFCVGGTLLGAGLAVMAAKGEDIVESVTFLAMSSSGSLPAKNRTPSLAGSAWMRRAGIG